MCGGAWGRRVIGGEVKSGRGSAMAMVSGEEPVCSGAGGGLGRRVVVGEGKSGGRKGKVRWDSSRHRGYGCTQIPVCGPSKGRGCTHQAVQPSAEAC